jgi:hypothetical protein
MPHPWKDLQTVFLYGSCLNLDFVCALFQRLCGGIAIALGHSGQSLNEPLKFWKEQVEPMSATASSSTILPISVFPAGVDMHWETQRRVVWNEREHTSEEHELVYEISWVEELGLWRSFLRSHHKVNG